MQLPVLYSFRRCPYAMRARLALAVSGQACELREVALRARPAELYAISPKGTVPVLLHGKRAIEESLEIMRWTLGTNDPESWMPVDNQTEERTEQLLALCDEEFKHNLDRYKYATRHEPSERNEHRERGCAFLRKLDKNLANCPFLVGESLGLADQAIAPFVRQFAFTDKDWFDAQEWPHLAKWLACFLDSSLFARIMIKHPVWKTGDTPFVVTW